MCAKFRIFILLTVVTALISCNYDAGDNQLIIFHAGSLAVPFKEIAAEFNEKYPEVEVVMESAGSRKCARKIVDLQRECDIMASADYKVIDNLLIPDYASWNIKFAGNEMAVVYHKKSRYSDSINKENWYHILMMPDVVYGRSNPDFDPCGYRTVITSELAEKYYNIPGLASSILSKDVNYIRPKEVDLISLLEADVIDYMFLYRSVAEQHGLDYIILPDSINLRNPMLDGYYSTATVDISGKKPGETITKKGEAMVYGITILSNAPNRGNAMKFMEFLLNKNKGMSIMVENGQNSIIPSPTSTYSFIPKNLKKYASEEPLK